MEGQQTLLIKSLRIFYNDAANCRIFLDTIQSQGNYPSLRILDWFVTNYARKHGVVFAHNDKDVNVHLSYKQQLRAYSKRQFDPFCRRGRIMFPMVDPRQCPTPPSYNLSAGNLSIAFPNEARLQSQPDRAVVHTLVTTTGQLNFFRWLILYGVLDYAAKNKVRIEADMALVAATKIRHKRASSATVMERNKAVGPSLRPLPVTKKAVCRPINVVMSFS